MDPTDAFLNQGNSSKGKKSSRPLIKSQKPCWIELACFDSFQPARPGLLTCPIQYGSHTFVKERNERFTRIGRVVAEQNLFGHRNPLVWNRACQRINRILEKIFTWVKQGAWPNWVSAARGGFSLPSTPA